MKNRREDTTSRPRLIQDPKIKINEPTSSHSSKIRREEKTSRPSLIHFKTRQGEPTRKINEPASSHSFQDPTRRPDEKNRRADLNSSVQDSTSLPRLIRPRLTSLPRLIRPRLNEPTSSQLFKKKTRRPQSHIFKDTENPIWPISIYAELSSFFFLKFISLALLLH